MGNLMIVILSIAFSIELGFYIKSVIRHEKNINALIYCLRHALFDFMALMSILYIESEFVMIGWIILIIVYIISSVYLRNR